MIITEMTRQEIRELLERATIGRLACAKDDQPYVVPLSFAYNGVYLYSFTTSGQKVDYMRANPRVCVEFDEISATNQWQSVVVIGRFEELTKGPDDIDARSTAHALLSKKAEWWQPGYVKTIVKEHERSLEPVYFRIAITETSGHKTEKGE
ncbi:pyridoxamine 5'-phosphate oxidase family protein [Phyllobacterium lublinensis]|uniref:pyridoxamine 5'-phosphate oxidase family protein n=1 Tax=Phyllobacterium lublinensis TaxID=2875708 RepID=UPI001CCA4B9D|nr:pyridoxamine 5'-phosphate oxidase family protein [Phyllobacterium sp. 2063]MBZ9653993.1 pyridoxamine 5'-phosphate oxidase family protein [Phyllobacterium sp. 2063]